MDVDGNGHVDVVDALVLRQHVEARAARAHWDFDRDGDVDVSDVDLLMKATVRAVVATRGSTQEDRS
jgi:hypothetical protein